ncbi:MAG: KOW domain-containing RNA-binding protein [Clostridia bacterium]|nr:KOW domain-containing RNA-binding protein [Clostridia bacterium]
MKELPDIGDIVVSTAGHDAGDALAVIAVVSNTYVLLADGIKRTADNPKLKKIKHIRLIGRSDRLCEELSRGITDNKTLSAEIAAVDNGGSNV